MIFAFKCLASLVSLLGVCTVTLLSFFFGIGAATTQGQAVETSTNMLFLFWLAGIAYIGVNYLLVWGMWRDKYPKSLVAVILLLNAAPAYLASKIFF